MVYVKVGTEFIHLYTSPKLDWCNVLKGGAIGRFMKNFVNYVKEFAPVFAHKCPFLKGKQEAKNLTVLTKNFNFIPAGSYKNLLIISDKIDENIFTLIHYTG